MNFNSYLENSISNLEMLNNEEFLTSFNNAAEILLAALTAGKSILVCGNGGSHADAQHFAGELVNYFTKPHKALSVITLGTNSAVVSAWSNDHRFEDQFAREVEAYGREGSALIGITTSGESKNVNSAFERAHGMGMKTIALTSQRALQHLSKKIDSVIAVPVVETHKIQECHIVIYHAICIYIENELPNEFLA